MMEIRPNQTIYINNLNEKIKKEGCFPFHFIEIIISHNPMMKTILVLEANTLNRTPVLSLP